MAPLFTEQWSMLHCCGSSPLEAAKCSSTKPATPSLFLVGPTTIKHFFLLNQTMIRVVSGEAHLQPHYQTATDEYCCKCPYL